MFEALRNRVRSARRDRALTALLDQRRTRPRDPKLGLAIHQAVRSGAKFREPLINTTGDARTLVIAEGSVDHGVLAEYLRAIPRSDAYIQGMPVDSVNAAMITPAHALIGRGTLDDADLARTSETFVDAICGALGRHVPAEQRIVAGIDTLGVLDFHLGDRIHVVGRVVRGLVERISSGQYGSIVFLVSNHQLWRSLEHVAQAAVGDENIHVFWIRKTAAQPAAPTDPPAPTTHVATESEPPPSTDVALMVEPQPRLTRDMSRVAMEVAKNHHVTIVASALKVDAHAGKSGHLAALAGEHPDQFAFICPDRDVPLEVPEKTLRDAVWNDDAVKALMLDGAQLHPLVKPILTKTFEEWAAMRRFAEGFDAYLRSCRPKILVVCPDRSPEARAACQVARAHGVVSYYPVPGMLSAYPRYKELQADFGSLMDDSQIEIHERARPADKGRMFADGVTNLDAATNAWLANAGSMPDRACVALILQPMTLTYNASVIRLVGEAMADIDADLLIRAHPSESGAIRQSYAELVANLPRAGLDDGPLPDLLERATLVVGAFSAVLIEAAIVGRPVLSINLSGDPFPVPVGEMGIATVVEDRDTAHEAIRKLLLDPESIAAAARRQQEYFERNPHLRAAPAAWNIARRVDSLIRSHVAELA